MFIFLWFFLFLRKIYIMFYFFVKHLISLVTNELVTTVARESASRTLLLASPSRHPWASHSATSAATTAAVAAHTTALIHSGPANIFSNSGNIWFVIPIWSNGSTFMVSSPQHNISFFDRRRHCSHGSNFVRRPWRRRRRRRSPRTGSWASD